MQPIKDHVAGGHIMGQAQLEGFVFGQAQLEGFVFGPSPFMIYGPFVFS